jgi:drug/metabolite transporter superfamily protein YnfA
VSDRKRLCYVNAIFSFLLWLQLNKPIVLTPHGLLILNTYVTDAPVNASNKQLFSKHCV